MITKVANKVDNTRKYGLTKESFGQGNQDALLSTMILLLVAFLMLYLGMELWNRYLTKGLTIVKKVNFTEFVGIYVLLMLLM